MFSIELLVENVNDHFITYRHFVYIRTGLEINGSLSPYLHCVVSECKGQRADVLDGLLAHDTTINLNHGHRADSCCRQPFNLLRQRLMPRAIRSPPLSRPVAAELSSRKAAAGDPEGAASLLPGPRTAQDAAAGQETHVPLLGNTARPQAG